MTAAHPYADAWPMFGENDLAELAADIAANGLLDPIVIDGDGLVLDGRHRLAACERAGVEPRFETYEGGDPLGFVLARNGQRRHQSKGSRAASWALAMLAAGERSGGRWTYGHGNSENSQNLTGRMRADLGVIADHAPDLLYKIRDDQLTLNAAYEQSCQARDAEADRIRHKQEEARAEDEAREFVEREAPDLATRVDGEDLLTYAEALDLWKRRNREQADRIAREKAERERREAEAKAKAGRISESLRMAVNTLTKTFGTEELREQVAGIYVGVNNGSEINQDIDADALMHAASVCDDLANRWEQR